MTYKNLEERTEKEKIDSCNSWSNDLFWCVPSVLVGGLFGLVNSLIVPTYIPNEIKNLHNKGIPQGLANFITVTTSIGVYGYYLNSYIQKIIENPSSPEAYSPVISNILGLCITALNLNSSKLKHNPE